MSAAATGHDAVAEERVKYRRGASAPVVATGKAGTTHSKGSCQWVVSVAAAGGAVVSRPSTAAKKAKRALRHQPPARCRPRPNPRGTARATARNYENGAAPLLVSPHSRAFPSLTPATHAPSAQYRRATGPPVEVGNTWPGDPRAPAATSPPPPSPPRRCPPPQPLPCSPNPPTRLQYRTSDSSTAPNCVDAAVADADDSVVVAARLSKSACATPSPPGPRPPGPPPPPPPAAADAPPSPATVSYAARTDSEIQVLQPLSAMLGPSRPGQKQKRKVEGEEGEEGRQEEFQGRGRRGGGPAGRSI